VVDVTPDEARPLDTATTPSFLGLDGQQGVWNTTGAKGEGVVVGIIDGGIWPEHPSVSDRTGTNGNATKDGKLGYRQLPGWNGRCVPGEQFTAANCNQKLIGAQFFNAGWGGNAGIDEQLPWEFNSPRDYGGHGTHTATTAAGNQGVGATGPAAVFGAVSGIAPRARIAAYKVCWETGTGGSCFNSDSVAAIDQAVADGVDVINFSVSGSQTNFRDPVEIAFLFAADAGIFVAASAGNSGPTTSTVAHPGPWLTTVAAGTHNRDVQGSVTLGNATTYSGASVATAVGPAPLIDAQAAGRAGADPVALRLCFAAEDNGDVAVLDPAKVAGRIVVCDRGVTDRTGKSKAVQEAGGVGMILANTSSNSLNADFHFVPTVHVLNTDRDAIKAYAATAGATATINQATITTTAPAPFTASFSSRGPLLASGDLLKPDLIAPGQDVLAGVAPPGNAGRLFDLYSGTSMSSPHVAGLAALFKQLYPAWSPMAIKSALMTTGTDVLDGPSTSAQVIFRQGAGHVQPKQAINPGLVFDAGFADWIGFLCGTQLPSSFCEDAGVPVLDPSDYNSASIAIGDLAGVQTLTRRVTNVSGGPITVTPSVTGLTGITAAVSPDTLTLAKGETTTFTVTFTRTSAALNAYTGGQLSWTGGGYTVRIPLVVRPVALAAPAEVKAEVGGASFDVTFGFSGDFSATPRGLVPAEITPGEVEQDPDQTFAPGDAAGTVAVPVTIPAGTTHTRLSLFDADVAPGADLDLYVYQGTSMVGSSAEGGSNEEVNFTFGGATGSALDLTVYVHGWGVPTGTSPFRLHAWSLSAAAAGNMTVTAPTAATLGEAGAIGLTFSELAPATRYLGSVAYSGAAGMPSPTIIRVDTP
jgi:subtilisin family serine protease